MIDKCLPTTLSPYEVADLVEMSICFVALLYLPTYTGPIAYDCPGPNDTSPPDPGNLTLRIPYPALVNDATVSFFPAAHWRSW